jgi:hypothetical protein
MIGNTAKPRATFPEWSKMSEIVEVMVSKTKPKLADWKWNHSVLRIDGRIVWCEDRECPRRVI